MRHITRRFGSILMALALVTAAFGVAFAGGAAAVTAESDWQLDDTDEVLGFEADAEEPETVIYETTLTSDTLEDFETLELEVSYDNNTLETYTSFDADVSGDDDDTTPLTLEWEVDHSDLEQLPGDAGEVTTADAEITELEDADEATEETTAGTVDFHFADTHATVTAFDEGDDIVSDFEAVDDDDGLFSSLAFWGDDASATIEEDVGIAGNQTDVNVYAADDDVAAVYDDYLEDADDGDRVGMLMTSSLDDGIVYVFANEAGETVTGDDVTDEDTYIVAHEGGEYTVNLGDEYEDETEASISLTAGEQFDRSALQDDLDYTTWQSWGLSFDTFELGDLWPF